MKGPEIPGGNIRKQRMAVAFRLLAITIELALGVLNFI
jgi:hypothetical protein